MNSIEMAARMSPMMRVAMLIPVCPRSFEMRAESDSRVDPAHAMEMAARLQAASASGSPVLLRFETKAGHGIGAPTRKVIDEYADYLSFFSWRLGMEEE
jgi:prolyl oligopeptidase